MRCLTEDFISENGVIITKNQVKYETNGGNSNIWKYERDGKIYAFKEFYNDHHCYSLRYDVYQRMRELPLRNIVKALESYKKISNTHEKSIDGYLMDYIPGNLDFSSMDYPIDTLLESTRNLEKDIEDLSNAHIIMYGVGPRNSIIGKDDFKLNVVDTDMYYYDRFTTCSDILTENRSNIFNLIRLHLFRGLIYCEELNDSRTEIREFLKEYFNPKETKDSLTTRVEELFGKYDTPKQYFLQKHVNK